MSSCSSLQRGAVGRRARRRPAPARRPRRSRRGRCARIGCSSSCCSMSHTICWACVAEVLGRLRQVQQARAAATGRCRCDAGPQHPQLEPVLHLVEAVLEVADLGGQALVAQHERRVGEADGGLGDVLHLDEHVDGPVEVGERAVLGRRGRLPPRARRPARAAGRCRPASPGGTARRPGRRISSPSTSVIQSRPRRMATTRMPVCTGSSRSTSGRRARCEPSRTRTRCETSSALDRSATSSRGMPRRWVTMRAMSTAALAMRSMARDDLEHRRHRVGLRGGAGGQHAHRPHVVDEVVHALLELADLLGHVGVAEVQRGVGEVDHQLGGVLGLREHGPQVAGSFVHGGSAPRGCRDAAGSGDPEERRWRG